MLLSALVFSMALMAWQIQADLYRQYERNSEEIMYFDRSRALLSRDIAMARKVYISPGLLQCVYQDRLISYAYGKNGLLRSVEPEAPKPDTLLRSACRLEAFWNREPMEEGFCDVMKLFVRNGTEELEMSFEKKKDATELMR